MTTLGVATASQRQRNPALSEDISRGIRKIVSKSKFLQEVNG
jgi:hypothetical protein